MSRKSIVLGLLGTVAALAAEAVTIRTKNDLRLWQTVFDRTAPLAWNWADGADAATVTFRKVKETAEGGATIVAYRGRTQEVEVVRASSDDRRGTCPIPSALTQGDDVLVEVSLVQKAASSEIESETARIALVSGVGTNGSIKVFATETAAWSHVFGSRLAGFDAAWWNLDGPSGYEVFWKRPVGWYRVERSFSDFGVVDEALLHFGRVGFAIFFE